MLVCRVQKLAYDLPMLAERCLWLAIVCALLVTSLTSEAQGDRASARALVDEGASLERAGDDAEALDRFERAIASDPDYLPAYDRAAWLWIGKGRYRTAIARLERVTLRQPRYAFGWYALAYAYRKTQRHDLAAL